MLYIQIHKPVDVSHVYTLKINLYLNIKHTFETDSLPAVQDLFVCWKLGDDTEAPVQSKKRKEKKERKEKEKGTRATIVKNTLKVDTDNGLRASRPTLKRGGNGLGGLEEIKILAAVKLSCF